MLVTVVHITGEQVDLTMIVQPMMKDKNRGSSRRREGSSKDNKKGMNKMRLKKPLSYRNKLLYKMKKGDWKRLKKRVKVLNLLHKNNLRLKSLKLKMDLILLRDLSNLVHLIQIKMLIILISEELEELIMRKPSKKKNQKSQHLVEIWWIY